MSKQQNEGLIAATLEAIGAIGRHNSAPRLTVARSLGMDGRDGERTISKLLEIERKNAVICSCGRGLFLPEDSPEGDREVAAYIAEVTRKGAGSFRSIQQAKKYLAQRQQERSGQVRLTEAADVEKRDN